MSLILSIHRTQTEQIEAVDFLAHFPGFVVQYLDDSPARDPRKAATATRFSPEVAARKQREGCGVYFAPNAFDGRRRMERLLRIQAVFLDVDVAKERDGLPQSTIEALKERALVDLVFSEVRPHAVIETKNGLHALWLIETQTEVQQALALFRLAMQALIGRFGGDPGARDPTRLLRLPGFLHLKNPADPFPCSLLWCELDRARVRLQMIIDAYQSPEDAASRPTEVIPPPIDPARDEPDIADVIRLAAWEAGITVTFRQNHDGSRQIIEDGQLTSGFLSARGNFCYSSSGKGRRGGPKGIVRYYLGLGPSEARDWLAQRFGRASAR